jgi:ferredoxin-NADP reductase
VRERRGKVRAITPAGPRALLIEIQATNPTPVRWRAGQFVSVRIDETGDRRSFSIASPPGTGDRFELLVGGVSPGGGTARFVAELRVGDEIEYFGPMGYFHARPDHPGELLCGVTGVGISAVLPILGDRAARGGSATLFWSVRGRDDAALLDRVEALRGIELHLYITGEGSGRLTDPLVDAVLGSADPLVVLCGNPFMVGDVIAELDAAGFETATRVITEVFYPQAAPLQM